MKLINILAGCVSAWPKGAKYAAQDAAGIIRFYEYYPTPEEGGGWHGEALGTYRPFIGGATLIANDQDTACIYQSEWESARKPKPVHHAMETLAAWRLDFINNYLSLEVWAEQHGLTTKQAHALQTLADEVREQNLELL